MKDEKNKMKLIRDEVKRQLDAHNFRYTEDSRGFSFGMAEPEAFSDMLPGVEGFLVCVMVTPASAMMGVLVRMDDGTIATVPQERERDMVWLLHKLNHTSPYIMDIMPQPLRLHCSTVIRDSALLRPDDDTCRRVDVIEEACGCIARLLRSWKMIKAVIDGGLSVEEILKGSEAASDALREGANKLLGTLLDTLCREALEDDNEKDAEKDEGAADLPGQEDAPAGPELE